MLDNISCGIDCDSRDIKIALVLQAVAYFLLSQSILWVFTLTSFMETQTKSLEGVWCSATCRVSAYGQTKNELRKSQWSTKVSHKPTRCVEIQDAVADLKDHYWLLGTTYLQKWSIVDLSLKMSWCEGYGYRVIDWKYI